MGGGSLLPEVQARRAGLPTPDSTHSYWHRDPSKKLLGHRTTADLPATADVVVVGSGISGAFAARKLLTAGRRRRQVVMLEAREACWGATGRNGGHCQPAVWNSVGEVARFELGGFALVRDLVQTRAVPCDWQTVGGIRAIYSPEVLAAAERQIARLHRRHPDLADKAQLITDRAELVAHRIPDALGAIFQPNAAKLWPYKLVAWILEDLLASNSKSAFNLQTNTSVTRLERYRDGSSSSPWRWVVHTPRGAIRARDVLLATNAYTSHLLPGLTDVIVPVRGQVCALEPPAAAAQLAHSYVWFKDPNEQYLIHRGFDDTQIAGTNDRSLILGGERFATPGGEEGIWNDDAVDPDIGEALRRSLYHTIKLLPTTRHDDPEKLPAAYEWTGIMGYSRDGHPWVGRVPAVAFRGGGADEVEEIETDTKEFLDGLWISAAFTGHGMPVAPRCGVAVAEMILRSTSTSSNSADDIDVDDDGDAVQVPTFWVPTSERISVARLLQLPRTIDDVLLALPVED